MDEKITLSVVEKNYHNTMQFTEALIRTMNTIALQMGEYVNFSISEAMKANDNHTSSIVAHINDSSNVSPTIYPEMLYEQYKTGTSLEEIAESQINALIKLRDHIPEFDISNVNVSNAKEHAYYQILNADLNKDIAEKCPCVEVADDLIAVPRWSVSDDDNGKASFLITNTIVQEQLQLTKEEIHSICQSNIDATTYTVTGMSETIAEIMRDQGAPEDYIDEMIGNMQGQEQMYVITNLSKIDGSSALLSDTAMQTARDRIGEDFYILPSSRHEILAVPESSISSVQDLKDMVMSVNATEVSKSDFLSNNVYHYSGESREIKACFDRDGKTVDFTKSKSVSEEHSHATGRVM